MSKKRSTLLLLFFAMLPLLGGAHGAGEAIQQEHNGYLLSVGSADKFVYENKAGRLNFEIETKDGVSFEDYSGVWARIMAPDGEFLFAGNIERGGDGLLAGMSFSFPEPGVYDIALRFMDRGRMIAEASFDFPVLENPAGSTATPSSREIFRLLISLALGIMAGFAINDRFFKKRLS